jgi:Bacterial sugar transferase
MDRTESLLSTARDIDATPAELDPPSSRHPLRAAHRACAAILLVLTLPVMFVTAIVTLLGGSARVVYRQRQVGKDGMEFEMLEFCTRGPNGEVTRASRLLQRFSWDQLPKLVNVLRGEMVMGGRGPTTPAPMRGHRTPPPTRTTVHRQMCPRRHRRASRPAPVRRRGSRRAGAGSQSGPDDGDPDPPSEHPAVLSRPTGGRR